MRATPATVLPTINAMLGGSGHSVGQMASSVSPQRGGETAMAELAACLQRGRRSRAGVPFVVLTVTVYTSSPSSWTMRKEIQQFWESFSLHCLLTPVSSVDTWMFGQAWEQFFSKGPL